MAPKGAALDLLILSHDESWEYRFQVSSLAATTAASGKVVGIALFFGALRSWTEDRWSEMEPLGSVDREYLQSLGLPPLIDYLNDGRSDGLIKVYACSASSRFLNLEQAAVQERVDAIFGWQTFSSLIMQTARVITF